MAYLKRRSHILSIFGILFFLTGLLWNSCNHSGDFRVFYLAGERFLNHASIYNFTDGWSPFKYHPAWAVAFSLWSLLPFTLSALVFSMVNMSFWFLAARSWSQLLNYKLTTTSFFILVLLSLNALSAETAYGQVNGFIFWGATQIFQWMEDSEQKPLRSGLMLAVLLSLKLNLGILIFYVVYKNWRSAFGIVAGALGLHAVVALGFREVAGLELYRSWLNLLLTQSGAQFNTFEVQSVLRVCYVLFGPVFAKLVWAGLLVLTVLLGIYLDLARKTESALQRAAFNGGYWLAVIFFFSPLAWWYQVLYLFPLAFLLLTNSKVPHTQWLARICLFCFAFVSFNTIGRNGIFNFKLYMGYFIAGMILWGYFLGLQLLRKNPAKLETQTLMISQDESSAELLSV